MESDKWKHIRQAKQKALSSTGAIYRWTWKPNGMGDYTIESEDKKGSKGYAMFWSLLGRESWLLPTQQKGHIARQIALGCWRMLKQDHFGNAKRWLCFGKRHKIASLLESRGDCMEQAF